MVTTLPAATVTPAKQPERAIPRGTMFRHNGAGICAPGPPYTRRPIVPTMFGNKHGARMVPLQPWQQHSPITECVFEANVLFEHGTTDVMVRVSAVTQHRIDQTRYNSPASLSHFRCPQAT